MKMRRIKNAVIQYKVNVNTYSLFILKAFTVSDHFFRNLFMESYQYGPRRNKMKKKDLVTVLTLKKKYFFIFALRKVYIKIFEIKITNKIRLSSFNCFAQTLLKWRPLNGLRKNYNNTKTHLFFYTKKHVS